MKIIALILSLATCVSFVGCATDSDVTSATADPSQQMQPNTSFINAGNPAPAGAQRLY